MKDRRPLLSSAPASSILNAQFHYTSSLDTDIRKTFAKIRREQAKAAAGAAASNVLAWAKKSVMA